MRGIKLPNFAYEFSIPERSHRLCKTTERSFLLPLHALDTGFHLPLHPFFYNLLKEYGIAPSFSPNGWRPIDNKEAVQSIGALPKRSTWPHDAMGESGRLDVNLSTASIDYRVVANARIHPSSKDSSSESDNIFYEINEAMDIAYFISGARKKRKTTAEAVHINSTSEKEGNNEQLEQHEKRRADPIGSVTVVVEASNSPSSPVTSLPHVPLASSSIAIDEDTPHLPLTSLLLCLLSEKLQLEVMKVHLRGVKIQTRRKAYQNELAETETKLARVHELHFKVMEENETINRKNEDLIMCLAIVKIRMEGLACELAAERQNNKVTLDSAVFPCELQYDSWSFALTNSIRSSGSSSVSFSMTGGSFALANCVGGCGSSAVNLNITAVSFVLANYVGGYGFSPMSLNMTGRALLSQIVLEAATLCLQALI
ncbi:hypothetical protein GOBAR_AA17988 [Gossypium barbadense]|uniref:Uncharacterized protein n=1 Tax=Gossypium barbadense TaxID=3634 RepID=A0A2P5XH51_GOSBA|nr:hypothetical protein GOBAR_AA17988 [Gossypium barbadense]